MNPKRFFNRALLRGEVLTQESLVSELLRERRKDRVASLLKVFCFSAVGVFYIAWLMSVTAPFGPSAAANKPFAAVITISGLIAPGKPASYEVLAPLIKRAFKSPYSKGIVLQINSPGGTPVQSALIHDLITELKLQTKKPVIAVGEDMMTSGAYLIAMAADTIVANRSSITGSIGVISAGFGFPDLLGKLGIERRVMAAGTSKNMMDPFTAQTEADQERQRVLLDSIHGHFKDIVLAGRKGRLNQATPDLFEGAVWTGADALKYGLIDELGNVDSAIKKHFEITSVVRFEPAKPLLESMFGNFGLKFANGLIDAALTQPPVLR